MGMARRSGRLAYTVYRLMWQSLDWLFPPHCGGCGYTGQRWCMDCQANIHLLQSGVCLKCGEPLPTGNTCQRCLHQPPVNQQLRSLAAFDGTLREAIHKLKYNRDMGLGEALSLPLIKFICELGWHFELVLPVPLSKERLRQRGYNQSSLLAYPIALFYNRPFVPNALRRVRDTPSQVGLSASQRLVNVKGAFRASEELVKSKSVLVIDDVTTTGATMQACSQAILQAGAKEVFGLTLARAV